MTSDFKFLFKSFIQLFTVMCCNTNANNSFTAMLVTSGRVFMKLFQIGLFGCDRLSL